MPKIKKVPYWKTPAGRARLAERRRANQIPEKADAQDITSTPFFNYLLGGIEERIKIAAESQDVPSEFLAHELGKILQGKARRKALGT